jgi:CSLREA domain-containing protein
MHPKHRIVFILLLLTSVIALTSCSILEEILRSLTADCDIDPLVVTKTDDTNDGACTAGDCSLREAVITANSCPGVQTIELPAGGYHLTRLGPGEDAADTGDLDITDDVIIIGAGVPSIHGEGDDRVIEIHDSVVAEFELLLITDGYADMGAGILNKGDLTMRSGAINYNTAVPTSGYSGGGGFFNYQGASATFIGTQFLGNEADLGAGIHNFATASLTLEDVTLAGNAALITAGGIWNNVASNAYLTNVEVYQNTAVQYGAGIYNNGHMEITASNFEGNTGPTAGGGLYNSGLTSEKNGITLGPGDAILQDVTFTQNSATEQGAGIFNGGSLELTLGTFTENTEPDMGGGIYNDVDSEIFLTQAWFTNNNAGMGGGVYNRGLVHLYQSSFTNNSAMDGYGGGAYNDGAAAALLLRNSTVSANMVIPPSTPGGSGIYNNGGDLRIEFSTIAHNNNDGIYNNGGHGTLESTILASHGGGNCLGAPLDSNGYNLESADDCGLIEPSDLVNTAPMIAWLAMNGGTNLSHAPMPGSPAIDSGDPDTCVSIDQRGTSRPQGAQCDRGSVEVTGDETPPPEPGDSEPTPVDPTPIPPPSPISINFNADAYEIVEGDCTMLRWEAKNADSVLYNGETFPPLEAEQVCPEKTTTYKITAVNPVEQLDAFVTINVVPGKPDAPGNLSIAARECNAKIYTVTLVWSDNSDNEDGFRLYREGSLIATLGENVAGYTDTPPYGGPYKYEVEAFNSAGASGRSSVVEIGCSRTTIN